MTAEYLVFMIILTLASSVDQLETICIVKNLVLGGSHQAHFRVAFTSEQSEAADCPLWRT